MSIECELQKQLLFQTEAPVPETNNSREMKIFKKVLRDSKLREPFYHFLDQQFCAENLNFYVAVEQFRDYYCEDDITVNISSTIQLMILLISVRRASSGCFVDL